VGHWAAFITVAVTFLEVAFPAAAKAGVGAAVVAVGTAGSILSSSAPAIAVFGGQMRLVVGTTSESDDTGIHSHWNRGAGDGLSDDAC